MGHSPRSHLSGDAHQPTLAFGFATSKILLPAFGLRHRFQRSCFGGPTITSEGKCWRAITREKDTVLAMP